MVLIAETAGLVGTALRRSPVGLPAGRDVFGPPRPATGSPSPQSQSTPAEPRWSLVSRPAGQLLLAPFVRPISGNGPADIKGHFHAAVVPYRPLPRGSLELTPTVKLLFEPARVENVLHLLGDSRPIVGVGESIFTRGAFWVVPLTLGVRTVTP